MGVHVDIESEYKQNGWEQVNEHLQMIKEIKEILAIEDLAALHYELNRVENLLTEFMRIGEKV